MESLVYIYIWETYLQSLFLFSPAYQVSTLCFDSWQFMSYCSAVLGNVLPSINSGLIPHWVFSSGCMEGIEAAISEDVWRCFVSACESAQVSAAHQEQFEEREQTTQKRWDREAAPQEIRVGVVACPAELSHRLRPFFHFFPSSEFGVFREWWGTGWTSSAGAAKVGGQAASLATSFNTLR